MEQLNLMVQQKETKVQELAKRNREGINHKSVVGGLCFRASKSPGELKSGIGFEMENIVCITGS